jgi:hypothetical protein
MKNLFIISLIVIFLSSCNNDAIVQSGNGILQQNSAYSGMWDATITGTHNGGGTIEIDSTGSFFAEVFFTNGDNSTLTGAVNSMGLVTNGKIHYNGTQVGSVTGNFYRDTANGSWSTILPSSGTWKAIRSK